LLGWFRFQVLCEPIHLLLLEKKIGFYGFYGFLRFDFLFCSTGFVFKCCEPIHSSSFAGKIRVLWFSSFWFSFLLVGIRFQVLCEPVEVQEETMKLQ